MNLRDRECIADIANALELETAVEIGTHQAVFAKSFMKRFKGTITLIDPWEGFTEGFETYYPALDPESRDRMIDLSIARTQMAEFGDRVQFIVAKSEDVVENFKDDSVGIVYIDGLHDYESVKRDIDTWYQKVRWGGIISGHDFDACLPGVVQAVNEFRKENGLQIHLTGENVCSWWGIKR